MQSSLYTQVLQESPKKEREAAAFIVKELEEHLVKELPKANDPGYLKAVEAAFRKSRLFVEAQHAAASSIAKSAVVDPHSEEGERAKRALIAEHSFYGPRYSGLTSLSVFCRAIQTGEHVRLARDNMIAEFRQSMVTTSGHDPREVLILILLLRAITDAGDIRPQLILLICRWILSGTPSEVSYPIANWLNILPAEEFEAILSGATVAINPDHRTLEIGRSVQKITSFPLLPELAPWDLASFNTTTINNSFGSGSKSISAPKALSKNKGGKTKILGLTELNCFLEDSGAARITLAVEDDVIDLRPLLQHLKSLSRKEPNKRAKPDAKPSSV